MELDKLSAPIQGYPSHSFVIDRIEAKQLLTNCRISTEVESSLAANVWSLMGNSIHMASVSSSCPTQQTTVEEMQMNQQKTSCALQDLQENRQKRVAELVLQAQEMRLEKAQQEARKLKTPKSTPAQ